MKLGAMLKAASAGAYQRTSRGWNGFVDFMTTPPPPLDLSELKGKEGYSKKAYLMLSDSSYSGLRRKLFDKIIQAEKRDRYAYYDSWDEDQKALCQSALVYTADMMDKGHPMYEISDALGLNPLSVMEICKFFNDLEDDTAED